MATKTFKGVSMPKSELNAYGVGLLRLSEAHINAENFKREEIFGDDCGIKHCETPTFEKETETATVHVENEALTQERERQQKYNDTFKAGKCTFGDRDMNRHRDIQYSNVFPCGWHCPHCGMTWVD